MIDMHNKHASSNIKETPIFLLYLKKYQKFKILFRIKKY